MNLNMRKKIFYFFMLYFILALLFGFYKIIKYFIAPPKLAGATAITFSLSNYFEFFLLSLLALSCIIAVIIIFKKKLQKILLFYPIFFVIERVWFILLSYWAINYYGLVRALEIVEKLSKYDFFFYSLEIIIPLSFIYHLIKTREQ